MAGEFERLLIRLEADTAILRKAFSDADKQVAGFSKSTNTSLAGVERQISRASTSMVSGMSRFGRATLDANKASERLVNGMSSVGKQAATTGRQVAQLENQVRAVNGAGSFGGFSSRVFAGAGVGYLLRETIQLADTYTNMGNRLKFVTENAAQLEAVQKRLFDISQNTRGSLRDTSELYSRMAFALRDTGVSQNQVLKFTENLNKALALSGAAGAEASGALIQLSQGLASGTLRGQELNSILEQTPYVASLIAKQMGVTTGELRALGQQGKITGREVFEAITNASQELDEKFKHTVPTVSQGMTAIGNSVLDLVGRFNEATGAGGKFAEVLKQISEGIDKVDFEKLRTNPWQGKPFGAMGGIMGLSRMLGFGPTIPQDAWETTVSPEMDTSREATLVGEADLAGQQERLKALQDEFDRYTESYRRALQDMLDMDTTPIADKIDAISEAHRRGMIVHREYEKSNRRVAQQQEAINDAMLGQVIQTGNAIFGQNKKFAIAEAAISTYQGVSKALGAFPPPYNFAMAALVAAQGFAQVASIRSTNPGSSGGATSISTGGVGAGGGEVVQAEGAGSGSGGQAIGITLVGRSYDREQIRDLIEGLNDAVKNGARLYVK